MGRWGCGSTVTPDNSSWGVGAAVPLWNFEVASKVEAFGDIARHLTSDELGAREFLTSVNPRAQSSETLGPLNLGKRLLRHLGFNVHVSIAGTPVEAELAPRWHYLPRFSTLS